jgi:hypothetical protein
MVPAQPEARDMMKNIVAGALFDFLGYLTTRDKPVTMSKRQEPHRALKMLQEWADERKLDLDNADVTGWRKEIE